MKALRNDRTLTRLVGRVLCLIGLHRWRWLDCPWELIKRGCFARRVCTRCHRHFVRKSRCWTETINPASMTANARADDERSDTVRRDVGNSGGGQ